MLLFSILFLAPPTDNFQAICNIKLSTNNFKANANIGGRFVLIGCSSNADTDKISRIMYIAGLFINNNIIYLDACVGGV